MASPEAPANIEMPRPRTIFWQQMRTLEEVLADADENFAPTLRNAIADQLTLPENA